MRPRKVEPYPTDLWPRWSRRGATLSSAVARRWFDRAPSWGATPLGPQMASALGGVSIELGFLSVQPRAALERTYAQRPSVFALFSLPSVGSGAAVSDAVCVAVDAPLARWIAARCLGHSEEEAARWLAPTPWTAMEGAFALACVIGARKACEPGPPPVFRAASERWDDANAALAKGECALWPARVSAGSYAGAAALIVPASLAKSERAQDSLWWSRASALEARGRLVCARESIESSELGELFEGSLIVLGAPLKLHESGALEGPMLLSLGPVDCPVYFDGAALRCEGAPRARSKTMTHDDDASRSSATLEPQEDHADGTGMSARTALLSTVLVEVEVVIARGQFSVGEVASWRPGEVLALPTRVGEPVEVHAGGKLFARGELCDVEGEVGVRITELLG
jgi:flagellar motor switch/type III secretory pathway protein FliN